MPCSTYWDERCQRDDEHLLKMNSQLRFISPMTIALNRCSKPLFLQNSLNAFME